MKSSFFLFVFFISCVAAKAQTPIDDLQKRNLDFLKSKESKGYEFRSQIITEFDQANASQDVNIKLSKEYTYIVIALGDSNLQKIGLDIKPANNAKIEPLVLEQKSSSYSSYQLEPSKSGRFKISINVIELEAAQKGFISFMVLRK